MQIRIRKRSSLEWFAVFALFMPFALAPLISLLHVPGVIKHTIDVAWFFLLLGLLRNTRCIPNLHTRTFAVIAGLWVAASAIGFVAHHQSPLYYIWGIRNNVRYFVFFFGCILFISEHSVEHYLDFFDKLFWLNFLVVLFQFFVLGQNGDYLGGIFGIEKGCNATVNIFMLIVVTRSILRFMHYQQKLSRCLLICTASLVIATLSELKVFILELLVIVLLAAMMTKFSLRKLWICVGILVGAVVSAQMIAVMFPAFKNWFALKNIWKIVSSTSGYTLKEDLNRMTAVPIVLERFLDSPFKKLFGLGLGNCDHAAFDFLVTPFYTANNHLNYTWFSSAFMLLETGIIGLALYIAFFVSVYFAAGKAARMAKAPDIHCQLCRIMALMCVVLIIYNSSMRTDSAYMAYFILALPFIRRRRSVKPPPEQEQPPSLPDG